jgi:helicase
LKYGVSDELVLLVELKNIGRVRARALFSRGMKSPNDIKNDPEKFISIIGRPGLVTLEELKIEYKNKEKIKEEIIKTEDSKKEKKGKEESYKKQTFLKDY